MYPDDLKYTAEHEWLRRPGETADSVRIGITDYAQDALGDVVFVQVPSVGAAITAGSSVSEVESTKSVSEVYAPVTGTVVEANDELGEAPERLNDDPYGEGWICVIDPADPTELERLLDAEGYRELIDG